MQSKAGVFERLSHSFALADCNVAESEASPISAILDAQAVCVGGVVGKGERGYDPPRRGLGRKGHAFTDTDSRLRLATVSTADLLDSSSAVALLKNRIRSD